MFNMYPALLLLLLLEVGELRATPPVRPVDAIDVGRDTPKPFSTDSNALTRPNRLYTVCALGGCAEHGMIKDGMVYAPGGGGVACWEIETGKVVRRYSRLPDSACMPLLERGLLVGASAGEVRALSAADGKLKWHAATGLVKCEALVYWGDGRNSFVFAQADAALYKIGFDDGTIAAKYPGGSTCVPGLDKRHRWLYVQRSNRLAKLNADDLSRIWEVALDGPDHYSSPIVIDDANVGSRVFVATESGNIYCFSPDGKIVWRHCFAGLIHGMLTYSRGMLIEHGYPSIVRAVDARNGKKLWLFNSQDLYDSKETFWTAPILIGNRLLIPTADGIGHSYSRQNFFVLDPMTGKKLGQFEFDSPGSSCGVPMASAGIVIFHDNIHSRWTAVKVGDGEKTDWYPFRGDDAHSGVPAYQEKIVTRWYDEPQERAAWRSVRDWLFLDRFARLDAAMPGKADFPPLAWTSEGPPGSVAIRGGELTVSGVGEKLVGAHNEMTAAPLYTVEGTVTVDQTDAPNQWFAVLSSGWRLRLGLMAHSDGFIYYMNASHPSELYSSDQWIRSKIRYQANKPYSFKIRVNCADRTGEYRFDGEPLGKGRFAPYDSPCCVMAATQGSNGTFRLREIAVYRGDVKPKATPRSSGR